MNARASQSREIAGLHVRNDGPQSAPVLLLSNSLGSDVSMWDGQVAAWSGDLRIVRYDMRVPGRSAPAAARRTRGPTGWFSLVVVGSHDVATFAADERFLAERIPGARLVELDAAHLSNLEAAARFDREVGSFLRG